MDIWSALLARMTSDIQTKNVEPTWVSEIIHFWFKEVAEAHWFTKSDHIDTQIRDRFVTLHERLVAHDGLGVSAPRSILAVAIVLDQFSRNLISFVVILLRMTLV